MDTVDFSPLEFNLLDTDMTTQSQPLELLQNYVAKTKDTDYGLKAADEDEGYAARLIKTLQSLQNQVKQHEVALESASSLETQLKVDLLC